MRSSWPVVTEGNVASFDEKPTRSADTETRRPRVLFIAEAVTLAHVARAVTLAGGLDSYRYEVILAYDHIGVNRRDDV